MLSIIVALVVPIRRCRRGVRDARGRSTLTRVLMTRSILAALEMIELSPAKLWCSGPIGIAWAQRYTNIDNESRS